MKIAFIVSKFPKLSETFILNQAAGLEERDHEVQFVANSPADEEKSHGRVKEYGFDRKTSYYHMPSSKVKRVLKAALPALKLLDKPKVLLETLKFWKYGKKSLSLNMLYLASAMKQVNADVIHAHFGPNGETAQTLSEVGLVDQKIVTSFYGNDASKALDEDPDMFNRVFKNEGVVTVLSEDMKQKLTSKDCPESKIQKVPLCIDTDSFAPKEKDNDIPKILTVARFTEKKGLKYAVEALSQIDEEFKYHLVGDGELKSDIERQVKEEGLENQVFFHGWMTNEEVKQKMQESDIFLLPSVTASDGDEEGTPTVLLEAQAAGLPVVSTYHAGIPEIVEDGGTGLLAEERNIEELENYLSELLSDQDKRKNMGKKGRELIKKNHSIKTVSKRLVAVYNG